MPDKDKKMFEILPPKDGPPEYHLPTGGFTTEKWWDEPVQPPGHIPLGNAKDLLTQIAEPQKGGKQSCFLTSLLNAWIVRGGLSRKEAQAIQDQVAVDPEYAMYWHNQDIFGEDFTAWTGKPMETAYAIRQLTGRRMAMSIISKSAAEAMPAVRQALDSGFALVVGDVLHSRMAFEPAEHPEKILVHDPKYPETTGLHGPESLGGFHTTNVVVII